MSLGFLRHFIASQLSTVPEITHSFTGQTVIVTGSNTGLGFEAAKHYVRLNAARVILAVRSQEKGDAAKQRIESSTGRTGVCEVWILDMSSYASIAEFVAKTQSLDRIDIVLANAGIVASQWNAAVDGCEMTMAVNVYGTLLLVLLMLPVLKASAKKHNILPVITVVSSEVHHFTTFDENVPAGEHLALLDDKNRYVQKDRYPVSKLLEVLYLRELAKHVGPDNYGVVINYANPGLCYSEIGRDSTLSMAIILAISRVLLARTAENGSKTIVWPTTAGPEGHGKYSLDCTFSETAVSRYVRGEKGAKQQKAMFEEINKRLDNVKPGLVAAALSV